VTSNLDIFKAAEMPGGSHPHKKFHYKKGHGKKKRQHKREETPEPAESEEQSPERQKSRPPELAYLGEYRPPKSKHPMFLHDLPDVKLDTYYPKEISYLLQQNAHKRELSQLSENAQHRLNHPPRLVNGIIDGRKLVAEWFPVLRRSLLLQHCAYYPQRRNHSSRRVSCAR
jgi:hypothetical protein